MGGRECNMWTWIFPPSFWGRAPNHCCQNFDKRFFEKRKKLNCFIRRKLERSFREPNSFPWWVKSFFFYGEGRRGQRKRELSKSCKTLFWKINISSALINNKDYFSFTNNYPVLIYLVAALYNTTLHIYTTYLKVTVTL